MKHKLLLISLLLLLSLSGAKGQLSVHIGQDISICRNKFLVIDTTQLNPIVTGSTGGYHCKWDFIYEVGTGFGIYIRGSSLLNDTTSCTPLIVYPDALPNNEWLPLYLTVTDSAGHTAIDSIHIRFSIFSFLADYTIRHIYAHDSVFINALSVGAIPPLHYAWSPTYALLFSDTVADGYVTPLHTTVYTCTVTDSIGCVSDWGDVWTIYVDSFHAGIDEVSLLMAKISPNPVTKESILHFDNLTHQSYHILVYDGIGKLVGTEYITNDEISLSRYNFSKGIYTLQIEREGTIEASVRFVCL